MSMNSSASCAPRGCLARADTWHGRWLTVQAIGWLCLARGLIALAPLRLWRGRLGLVDIGAAPPALEIAAQLARHVERAAARMPFDSKCLPRAMALSWMLRRRGIGHGVIFAIRPPSLRGEPDSLHAWVEVAGQRMIGDLPGPWIVTLRLEG